MLYLLSSLSLKSISNTRVLATNFFPSFLSHYACVVPRLLSPSPTPLRLLLLSSRTTRRHRDSPFDSWHRRHASSLSTCTPFSTAAAAAAAAAVAIHPPSLSSLRSSQQSVSSSKTVSDSSCPSLLERLHNATATIADVRWPALPSPLFRAVFCTASRPAPHRSRLLLALGQNAAPLLSRSSWRRLGQPLC